MDALKDQEQMLVLLAGRPTRKSNNRPPPTSPALRRALQNCQVTDSSTRLTEALELADTLTRDKHDPEIHLFSDGAAGDLSEFANKGLHVIYHRSAASGATTWASRRWTSGRTRRTARSAPFTPAWPIFPPTPAKPVLELLFDNQVVDTRLVESAARRNLAAGFHRRAGTRRHFHRAHRRQG